MNYRIHYSDELYHHGVKGMKLGVRKDPSKPALSREQRKSLKESYKKNDEYLSGVQHKQWLSYVNATEYSRKKTKEYIKAEKAKYKSGEITKDEYKKNSKAAVKAKSDFDSRQEYNMAVAQYQVARARSANKQIYIGSVKGENSKAYKRGEEHLKRNIEYWENYTIKKNSDGSYHVTRTEYVYY